MTKVPSTKRRYDLEERTAKFGEKMIEFCNKVPIVKAATSIGANYCEADDAESKKDFKHKIGICKKNQENQNTLLE